MEPQITTSNRMPVYGTGQARTPSRPEERVQSAEQLPDVAEMSAAQIQQHQAYLNRAQQNIDRLRYPESLPSLNGGEQAAPAAQASCPADGQRIRGAYDEENRKLDEIRASAMDTARRQGEGTRDLGGMKITVTREQSRVKVVMDSSKLLNSPSVITEEYDEHDPGFVRFSYSDPQGSAGSERNGTRIGKLERSGDQIIYNPSGDAMIRYTNRKDGSIEKITEKADGSREIINMQADGKVIARDGGSGETGVAGQAKETAAADAISLPGREYLLDYVRKHSYQLGGDGKKHPLSDEMLNRYVDGLQGFDTGTLKNLEKEGLSFVTVDSKKVPKGGFPGNSEWPKDATGKNPAGGYYNSQLKVIVLDENFHIPAVTHEIGHAIDDMLARDKSRKPKGIRYQSDSDSTLKQLYDDYQKRTGQGARPWSTYAQTNIAEYVAESVEYHNTPAISGILKENDPGMYAYVDELLKKSSQASDRG